MRILIIFFALSFTSFAFAQHERDYWYFGVQAGVHFDQGNPDVLLDGALQTSEGCASISTPHTGELMFYTNGSTIWNKNHHVMMNGTGLHGNISSTQSALIVPNPNKYNIYYVFTVDDAGGSDGLQYSEVDMGLDNGLGSVNSTKNVLLQSPVAEKLTAVRNADSTGYWVLGHSLNGNDFYAYSVTSSGLNTTPVISTVASPPPETTINFAGAMKLSPDGTKLAMCYSFQEHLYDFDNSTGVVSNLTILHQSPPHSDFSKLAYGVEFSPNSKVLYFNFHGAPVVQYNLEAGDADDIIDSRIALSSSVYGGMQLGPDDKIYVATNQLYLDRIESPNVVGLGCNYQENAVDLQGRSSEAGLPNFVRSFIESSIFFENTCFGQTTEFSLANDLENLSDISWDFDDPASGVNNTSTLAQPTHVFSDVGTYTVTARVTVNGVANVYEAKVKIYEQPEPSETTLESCDLGGGTAEFDTSNLEDEILNGETGFNISYFDWNGDTLPSPLPNPFISKSQTLIAHVKNTQNPDCYAEVPVHLMIRDRPTLSLHDQYFICEDEDAIQLTADPGADTYLWSTGETTQTITVSEIGDYEVTATKNHGDLICENSKTIHVGVSGQAMILSIEVKDWTERDNSITVEANGQGQYLYSIDGLVYQKSNQFKNLDYNKDYTVYVKDVNGCGIVTKKVYLLYYPKFFTPNQDGINDTWQIFNTYKEPQLKIYIFDRYGKLLTEIDPFSAGWDGTFHGKPMPSDDYWFLVKRKNGNRYTGHFTLKR